MNTKIIIIFSKVLNKLIIENLVKKIKQDRVIDAMRTSINEAYKTT